LAVGRKIQGKSLNIGGDETIKDMMRDTKK